MERIASATHLVDLEHLGRPRAIACAVLETDAGLVLVDPGPASTLATLRSGLAVAGATLDDVTIVLLTHIHLDHAGATGALLREQPRVRVLVHERGAGHLVDPSRLLESAGRIYGDELDRMWGETLPVPEDRIQVLAGGERPCPGGRPLVVEHTPGHAAHHVCFLDESTGIAFVGDTTGVRFPGADVVVPVTPPPEVDLDAWAASLERIGGWRPERLFLTHFGPADGVEAHLTEFRERLSDWSDRVRAGLATGEPDDALAARFAAEVGEELAERLPPADARHYADGAALELCWHGLARYWRRRGRGAPPGAPSEPASEHEPEPASERASGIVEDRSGT